MNHTSGPWNYKAAAKATSPASRDELLDFGIIATINGEPHVIAEAFGRVDVSVYPDALANAVLIAAAPELLGACNGLLGLLELLDGRDDLPSGVRDAIRDNHRVLAALQAVQKAEGR